MPDLLASVLDARLVLALAAGVAAGLVRGFSGFGAAMVIMPSLGGLYGPLVALVVLTLVDAVAALPLLPDAVRRCRWRDIGWLLLPYGIALQIGVTILAASDPLALRVATAGLILLVVAVMATGWRYHRPPRPAETAAIGGLSGLMGGSTGIGGPPVILFWLGGQGSGPEVRANVIVFFALTSVLAVATLWSRDLFVGQGVVLSALILPVYAGAILAGAYLFRRTGDDRFRRVALALVAAIALASLAL